MFCWFFAFPAMIIGNSYWMMFAAGGIVLVGAAAAMHTFPTRFWHMFGAIGGMTLATLAMIFQFDMWYMAAGTAALSLLSFILDKKRAMWWTVLIIFTAISVVLGISIL